MKRCLDFLAALILLFVFLPLLGVIWLLVTVKLGSPALFRQMRPGLNGNQFELIKFRTMTDARDSDGNLLPDEQRLTGFGKWLRNTSLDELPELFNILKGEMSFVGPRPLLVRYLPLYSDEQARRHEVPPGLTGWAQVNGRNAISWDEKFQLDVWYVEHQSLKLDLMILVKTIWSVIHRKDISADESATMPEFFGNDKTSAHGASKNDEVYR